MSEFITAQEAQHLLSEVDPDETLVAARMHYPSGIHDEWIENLEELMWFLQPASDRDVPGVSIEGLAGWIENAVGDAKLAQEVRECEVEYSNFVDACEAAYRKVQARVSHLQKIAKGSVA